MLKDFLEVMVNRRTRVSYYHFIHGLLDDPDGFVKLASSDKKEAESLLLKRLIVRREEVANTTLKTSLACLRSFLEFEEVNLNWKKIMKAVPSSRMVGRDRPPTLQEIRDLLGVCDKRMKAIVLVMCSSGIRVGAFDYLNLGDYSRLESGIGRILVYRGEPEEYITFITPEAVDAYEAYLDERKKAGEALSSKSPFIREALNYIHGSRDEPMRISSSGIGKQLYYFWIKASVKERGQGRGEFKAAHGFRKYFKTRAERSMKSIMVEVLSGRSIGTSNSYYKPSEKELIEEYLKAIPDLTISETEELRKQNTDMQKQFMEIMRSLETRLDRIELERIREKAETFGKRHT